MIAAQRTLVPGAPPAIPRSWSTNTQKGSRKKANVSDRSNRDAIIVGVDGSACANQAVRWAAGEAATRNVPLRIVHVIYPVIGGYSGDGLVTTPLPEELVAELSTQRAGRLDGHSADYSPIDTAEWSPSGSTKAVA